MNESTNEVERASVIDDCHYGTNLKGIMCYTKKFGITYKARDTQNSSDRRKIKSMMYWAIISLLVHHTFLQPKAINQINYR